MASGFDTPSDLKEGVNLPSQDSAGCDLDNNVSKHLQSQDEAVSCDLMDIHMTEQLATVQTSPVEGMGDSGAISLLLAPAGSMVVPPQTVHASNLEKEAFQQEQDGPLDQRVPEGSLSKEETVVSSLQEHFPSSKPVLAIYNSDNLKTCLQYSASASSAIFSDKHIPFSQELPKNNSLSTKSLGQVDTTKEEMLHQSTDKIWSYNNTLVDSAMGATPKLSKNPYSILPRQSQPEEPKKLASYAKVLMPPNVSASTTGSAPECGVVVERISGVSLESYAWAISEITGKSSIAFIGRDPRDPNYVLVFVKTSVMAEDLVQRGIWIRGRWLNVSFFQQPAVRLTVSGVFPFVPDSLIIDACKPFGISVYPVLRKIPASVRSQVFKGAFSFRREIYLVKNSNESIIPDTISISFLGTAYDLELTALGPKCFSCGSHLHTQRNCDAHTVISDPQNADGDPGSTVLPAQTGNEQKHNLAKDRVEIISQTNTHPAVSQLNTTKGSTKPKCNRSFFTQCNLVELPPLSNKNNQISIDQTVLHREKDVAKSNKQLQSTQKNNSSTLDKKKASNIGTKERPPPSAKVTSGKQKLIVDGESNEEIMPKKSRKLSGLSNENLFPSDSLTLMETEESTKDLSKLDKEPNHDSLNPKVDLLEEPVDRPIQKIREVKPDSKAKMDVFRTSLLKESKNSLKHLTNVEKDINEGVKILDDWLFKSKKLKIFPRKKLTAQFLVSHPNLEQLVKFALTQTELYPNGSFRRKKANELLEDITQLTGDPKFAGHQKRKQ